MEREEQKEQKLFNVQKYTNFRKAIESQLNNLPDNITLNSNELKKCQELLKKRNKDLRKMADKVKKNRDANKELKASIKSLNEKAEEIEQQLADLLQQSNASPNKTVQVPKTFISKVLDYSIYTLLAVQAGTRFMSGDYVGGTIMSGSVLLNMFGYKRLAMLIGLGGNLSQTLYPSQTAALNQYAHTRIDDITKSIKSIDTTSIHDFWNTIGFDTEPFKWVPSTTSTKIESLEGIPHLIEQPPSDLQSGVLSLTDNSKNIINENFKSMGFKDKEQLLRHVGGLIGFKDDTNYGQQILQQAIKNLENTPDTLDKGVGDWVSDAIEQTPMPLSEKGGPNFMLAIPIIASIIAFVSGGINSAGAVGAGGINPLSVTPGYDGAALGYAPGFN